MDALANPGKSKKFEYDNGEGNNSEDWREDFRSRFESILNGDIRIERDDINKKFKTGIPFKHFENQTIPKVFELNKYELNPIKLKEKISLIENIRYKV